MQQSRLHAESTFLPSTAIRPLVQRLCVKKYTRLGRWWDRKGENEIDLIAEDELSKSATFVEIKRQEGEISMGVLKQKAQTFLSATHQFRDHTIIYKGLSIDDM